MKTLRYRMTRGLLTGCLLMAALGSTALRADNPVKPGDFGYNVPLNVPPAADGGLVRFTLMPFVYRNVTRADLGDMRILNAAGTALPYGLIAPPSIVTAQAPVAVKIYPLPAAASSEDMKRMVLYTGQSGASIYVYGATTPPAVPSAYLIDTNGVSADGSYARHSVLTLGWSGVKTDFNAYARIEASDDLTRWRPIGGARLLQLNYADQELRQDRIELYNANARYLRLTWDSGSTPPELSDAHLAALEAQTPQRVGMSIPPDPSPVSPPDYSFDAGNPISAESLDFSAPGTGYLAAATISVRDAPDQPWKQVASGVFYHLQQGSMPIFSSPLQLPGTAHGRYWLVHVDPRSSSLNGRSPSLELLWTPQQVIFLAQPPGPYVLAFGNPSIAGANLPLATLLPGYDADPAKALSAARLIYLTGNAIPEESSPAVLRPTGTAVESPAQVTLKPTNPAALAPPPTPPIWRNWQVWLAWTSLCLGVLLLGWMAWRLVKQMEQVP